MTRYLEAAYTEKELLAYDAYWDAVSTERTLISGRFIAIATSLEKTGMPLEEIQQHTYLPTETIATL